MKKIRLIKKVTAKGLNIYSAIDDDDKVLYKSSPTHRTYVAMFLSAYRYKDSKGNIPDGVTAVYRFGRMDLVGKGESRHMFGDPDAYYAVLWEPIKDYLKENDGQSLLGSLVQYGFDFDQLDQAAKQGIIEIEDHMVYLK